MKATFKMLFFAQRARVKSNGKAPILARITDQKIAGDMDTLASKIGGQHPTPPEPSSMSKGTTTKARKQAVEIPTFRMVSGL